MKKTIIKIFGVLFSIVCIVFVGTFVYHNYVDNRIENREKTNNEIEKLIVTGNYAEAYVKIEDYYKNFDYSDEIDGYNKMYYYQLYYDNQGMYDEEMKVLIDYVSANEFSENAYETNLKYYYSVESAKKIIDKVSEENKNKAIQLFGDDIAK